MQPTEAEEQESAIEVLAEDIAEGRSSRLCELFADWKAPQPLIEAEPDPQRLPHERLRFLLEYWRGLPRPPQGDLPLARLIDAIDLKPALGYTMLLEVLDGGRDFRYRVYPTEVARAAGVDYSGRRTSEIPVGVTALFYLASYRAVLSTRKPLYSRHGSPPHLDVYHWDRLILPFADERGDISRFLVGNIPGPQRSSG